MGGQSDHLFEAYSVPWPARPLFPTTFRNLHRRSRAWSQTSPRVPITSSTAN